MIYSKESFSRTGEVKGKTKKVSTINKDEFLEFTKSVWTFNTESAKRVKHPAPYPVELPYRLIQLYSFKDDVIIDPFCGSGTTCIAAVKSNRNYIGIDNNQGYVDNALKRMQNYIKFGEDVIVLK